MKSAIRAASALFAIIGLGAVAAGCLACCEVMRIMPKVPECEQLEADDIPLMTEEQREDARQTGIAAYDYNGMHYVDASLPSEYYGG